MLDVTSIIELSTLLDDTTFFYQLLSYMLYKLISLLGVSIIHYLLLLNVC